MESTTKPALELVTVPVPQIGDHVVYTDEVAVEHQALVTAVWGDGSHGLWPSINLVYVSGDASQTDPYGRQIARNTSVVHKTSQPAHGRFWR